MTLFIQISIVIINKIAVVDQQIDEMAMLSWIASESRENLIFVLSTLKSLTDTPPNYFLIDKDLVEWNAIIEVFPQAVVLLCTRVFLKTQNVSDRAFNKQCS